MTREPIAIVGIGCRFPGGADDPESFWRLLADGRDAIGPVPPDRFDADALYDPTGGPGRIAARQGGFLEGVDRFDAAFFGISPREAERLDPQQRLLLEVSWEALEDAGQVPDAVAGTRTAVYVGLWLSDYEARLFADPEAVDFHMTTGSGRYSASGRLSYAFGLLGPSVTLDTACSSSLVAVHLACRSIQAGECELALAGGANVILQPHISIAYSGAGMLAADGRCKFGDVSADGYVRSEGAGMVALKPLGRALADGDRVRALVLGSAVNNDGRTSGELSTPGVGGQQALLEEAWADAGVTPERFAFLEAHGTGTRAGDPVELTAIGRAFARGARRGPCPVGSVKTNLGHTEGAAGVAGLIKAALALEHRVLPASLHLREPNPDIPWDDLGVMIPGEPVQLPADPDAVAGVSAFGIAGTNAHVVLGRAPERPASGNGPSPGALLLPISAAGPGALAELAARHREALGESGGPRLADLCFTAATRRGALDHRAAIAFASRAELAEALDLLARGELPPRTAIAEAGTPGRVVFVFPGQGSQWLGMGRELLARDAAFRDAVERCEAAMAPYADWSLLEQLGLDAGSPAWRLDSIDVLQPALLAVEIGLAAVWRSLGVEPDAVVGHSMGEVAAAHVAGALSLEDAMRVICTRSRLLRRTSGRGAMASVELTAAEAEEAVAPYGGALSVAVANSPRATVVAGVPEALEQLAGELSERGVFCRPVKVDVASHSAQVDPLLDELERDLAGIAPREASIPVFSTALATVLEGPECGPAYWVRNLRHTVRFAEAVDQLLRSDHGVFVELSPHPVLLPAVEQCAAHAGRACLPLASMRREQPERLELLRSLGALWAAGGAIDLARLHPQGGEVVSLPTYPWQRERFWYEARRPAGERPGGHPLLGRHLEQATGEHVFEAELDLERSPFLGDHRVRGAAVLPAAAYADLVLAAAATALDGARCGLEGVSFLRPLPLDDPMTVQLALAPSGDGTASFQIFSRRAGAAGSRWELHAAGRVRPAAPAPGDVRVDTGSGGADQHYAELARRGLAYGPAFRTVEAVEVPGDRARGRLAPVAAGRHVLHPATLDGCFQLLAAALAPEGGEAAYLPASLAALDVYRTPEPDEPLSAEATVTDRERGLGDVILAGAAGEIVAVATGLELARVEPDPAAVVERLLHEVAWVEAPAAEPVSGEAGSWLVLADERGTTAGLAGALERAGQRCRLLPWSRRGELPALLEELGDTEAPLAGVVHLWGADAGAAELAAAEERGSLAALDLLSALAAAPLPSPPRVVLVTRGSRPAGSGPHELAVSQAPLWGLGAVVANERPELACLRVDLDPRCSGADGEQLAAELLSGSGEDEVALRGERRYVARLVAWRPEARQRRRVAALPGQAYRLALDEPGLLDGLSLRACERRPPGPGEVELEIAAAGLNFIDVMKAMGIYPGLDASAPVALGGECSGRVVAVGDGVQGLATGDDVVAITPSLTRTGLLASHATVPAALAAPAPPGLSAVEAATLPIAFVTARLALVELARLRPGELVLVHSATGGVGLAALQIARAAGAEVIATAGSEERRDYLRRLGVEHVLDSRSLDFAVGVLEITGGRGVDVVLNSLAGEGLRRSLDVLAPYGRFVELGKRDIHGGSLLRLDAFARSLSFTAVDLARDVEERPEEVGRLLRAVLDDVREGALAPLPAEVLPIGEAEQGFRRMARAEHVGKVVFAVAGEQPLVEEPAAPIRRDGVYAITGGLGALGLETARWLAGQGARRIALLGRGSPGQGATAAIDELRESGAEVRVLGADVTDRQSLAAALAEARSLGPLHGVVHAAGVLDDALLEGQTAERFRRASAPKVAGAWNLHELTRDDPLDLFVLYGSVAPLLGIPGQANYAAGNAFLDALAHRREAEGRPALAVDWAPWAGAGLAAADEGRGSRLASRGLASLTPAAGIAALGRLLRDGAVQTAVVELDVARWAEFNPHGARSPFFAELREGEAEPSRGAARLREELLATEAGRARHALLETRLREHVARVLRLAAERVPLTKPFKALGMDSLLALELRNRLEAASGLAIPATALFNYPTVAELAGYVASELDVPLEAVAETSGAAEPEPDDGLEGLNRAELERLLASELEAAQELLQKGPA